MNSGIPYFPLDVHLDDKFELIEAEFGLKGFAVVVKLLQRIYGGQGYYCEWTNDIELLFSKSVGQSNNLVSQIVSAAVKRGIFDSKLYDKYSILTSQGIQKRYFEAVSRRKEVNVKKQYLLIDVGNNYKNVSILSENANNSSENANNSKQSKAEDSKVKDSKAEEINTPPVAVPQNLIDFYQENISRNYITPRELDNIKHWLDKVESEMILWAMQQAADYKKPSWKYIEGILKNHFNAGRTTLAAVQDAQRTYKVQKDVPKGVYDDSNFDYAELEKIMQEKG